jgi:methionyl-tRNA formyltransferase
MSKRILFFGNERLATGVSTTAPTLQGLIGAGYEIPAVVVAQNPGDKSRSGRRLEVADVAAEHNIPVISPADLAQAKQQLLDFDAEAALLVAYGKIIPQEILDIFPKGIINIHPSLLPLYRGPTPLESVILNNEARTGVSLMRLGAKMDDGPVYAQQAVALKGSETKQGLADQLIGIGAKMVGENLPIILGGALTAAPQDESKATFSHLITKDDGRLDWNKPAARLAREVRAYAGWPRSRARLGYTDAIVTQAHALDGSGQPGNLYMENKQFGVYAADGVLIIDELIPAGKKAMSAQSFLAGYRLD